MLIWLNWNSSTGELIPGGSVTADKVLSSSLSSQFLCNSERHSVTLSSQCIFERHPMEMHFGDWLHVPYLFSYDSGWCTTIWSPFDCLTTETVIFRRGQGRQSLSKRSSQTPRAFTFFSLSLFLTEILVGAVKCRNVEMLVADGEVGWLFSALPSS